MVGSGGLGFGREDPPLDPLESVWDGRDPHWLLGSQLGRLPDSVSLAGWVGSAVLLDRPSWYLLPTSGCHCNH